MSGWHDNAEHLERRVAEERAALKRAESIRNKWERRREMKMREQNVMLLTNALGVAQRKTSEDLWSD